MNFFYYLLVCGDGSLSKIEKDSGATMAGQKNLKYENFFESVKKKKNI